MQTEVLSLGGSIIVPDAVNMDYLQQFCSLLKKFRDRKFIIVVGGGSTARKYIHALKLKDMRTRATAGILVTRFHAWFMAQIFGRGASHAVPKTMKEVEYIIRKNDVVFVGALRFHDQQTSDGTAAQLANHLKTRFINITNVAGLYTRDPTKFRDAKLIPQISPGDFYRRATKMKFEPGQHFVLDQHAAEIIKYHHIPAYIVGKDLRNLERLLRGKGFIGTTIL